MFTDGLSEAAKPDGEPFGVEGLREAMQRHADLDVQNLVIEIHSTAEAFVHGAPFEDDLCLVAIHFLTPQAIGSTRRLHTAGASALHQQ